MPHAFDAANKYLTRGYPADWLAQAGLPQGTSVDVVDADLSTVSAAADKVLRVNGPNPYGAHLEFQGGRRPGMDLDMLLYNTLARKALGLPVKSVLFALRPAAVSGLRGGVFDVEGPDHRLQFTYKVVRVWELPPEALLAGGLGTLPLAPIGAVAEGQLPAVVEAVGRRFEAEAGPGERAELWAATEILMGLRWPQALIHRLMKGSRHMEESVIYQEILAKGIEKGIERGRVAEARAYLLRRGAKRLGEPDAAVRSRLEAIGDAGVLETLTDQLWDGSFATWGDLLDSMK